MKTKAGNDQKASKNKTLNIKTLKAYKDIATKLSKKEDLAQAQKDRIKDSWINESSKRRKKKTRTMEQVEEEVSKQIDKVQKFGTEI